MSHRSQISEEPEFVNLEVKVLPEGSAFGELALIDKKPRAATITCKENSHFAILEARVRVIIGIIYYNK